MKDYLTWLVTRVLRVLSGSAMVPLRVRGSADETVVIVKLDAGDGMVTYLRIKHSASDQQGVG